MRGPLIIVVISEPVKGRVNLYYLDYIFIQIRDVLAKNTTTTMRRMTAENYMPNHDGDDDDYEDDDYDDHDYDALIHEHWQSHLGYLPPYHRGEGGYEQPHQLVEGVPKKSTLWEKSKTFDQIAV